MFGFAKKLAKHAEGIFAPEIQDLSPPFGFRILWTSPDGNARAAGLESLFDYIVRVDGEPLTPHTPSTSSAGISVEVDRDAVAAEAAPIEELQTLIRKSPAAATELGVWSAKGRQFRTVFIPQGLDIGAEVQWTSTGAADNVWHILEVKPNSPADAAGLIGHADYIVGAEEGSLEVSGAGESLLSRVITGISTKPGGDGGVTLFVYNHDYNVVRPVRVFPNDDGRGNKILGCGVGYGLLHRLPAVEKPLPPGDTMFDATASSLGAPPSGFQAPIAPMASPLKKREHPHNHHGNPKEDLSSYFDEQTRISREHDTPGSLSSVTAKDLPPPPSMI